MEAKHTPGPWMVVREDEARRLDLFEIAEVERYRIVRSTGNGYSEAAPPDGDARLIAAAPDLLFQLLAASNYIDALGGDSKSYRAAIAAATGSAT